MRVEATARVNLPEWTVSELSAALKKTVEDAYGYVRVRGEVSGFKGASPSGHVYFRLKDDRTVLEWTEPVKATAWATGGLAYPFTRTIRLFGHAAPSTFMEASELQPGGGLGFGVKTQAQALAFGKAAGQDELLMESSQAQAKAVVSASQALPRIVWPVGRTEPGATTFRMRSSTASMPSARASLSMFASCAKHTCGAPKPRIAPHGGLFV